MQFQLRRVIEPLTAVIAPTGRSAATRMWI